ncbi:MAG: hypothetical protein LBN22_10585, partial [Clostridiales Family XIII bacterium]|nr:hypothetical protein [Clostridiales Family XIII bacterium]
MNDTFTKKIYDKILLSTLLALIGSTIGTFANSVIIGRLLGSELLSVPSLTMPIHYIFAVAGALLGVGGMTVCASHIGEHNLDKCNRAFTITWIVTIIVSIVLIIVVLICLDSILHLIGVPPESYVDTKTYAIIQVVSGFFIMGVYPVFNLLRLDGRTVMSVLVFAIMAIFTIFFDILFIYVLKMGILGAALAVYGGTAVSVIFGLCSFYFSGNLKFVRIEKIQNEIDIIKNIFHIGLPSAMENICILLKTFFLNTILLKYFGVLSVSAFSIINSINGVALVFIAGVSGTTMAFNGVFFAERDTRSIKQIINRAFLLGCISVFVLTMICMLFPAPIAHAFGISNSSEAMAICVMAVKYYAISFIPAFINNVLICLYQSTGRTVLANILNLTHGLLFIVMISVLFVNRFGINVIWNSFWIGEVLTVFLALILGIFIRRNHKDIAPVYLLDISAEKNGVSLAFSVEEKSSDSENCDSEIMKVVDLIAEHFMDFPNKKITNAITHAVEEMLFMIKEHNFQGKDFNASIRIL